MCFPVLIFLKKVLWLVLWTGFFDQQKWHKSPMYDYHLKQSIYILLPLLFENLKENHIEEASGGQTLQYQQIAVQRCAETTLKQIGVFEKCNINSSSTKI